LSTILKRITHRPVPFIPVIILPLGLIMP